MDAFLEHLADLIQTNQWVAPFASFLGGALTASNPCVLAMIPLMIAFVGGYGEGMKWQKSLSISLAFVLGLTVTFTILGIISALLGMLLGDVGSFWTWAVAGVCFIMGLHLLGLFRFELPFANRFQPKQGGVIGAFLLGLLFGLVSTPCATPILAVLIVYIASQGNVAYGAFLLFFYALGHCLLILVAGLSMGIIRDLIESKRFLKGMDILRKGAGVLIIGIGLFFLKNQV